MSDLTEFLLARIAEDESDARRATEPWYTPTQAGEDVYAADAPHIARWSPARVLAECEAKRRIIDAAWGDLERIEGEWGTGKGRAEMAALNDYPEALTAMGAVYADHPDYRQEWKP